MGNIFIEKQLCVQDNNGAIIISDSKSIRYRKGLLKPIKYYLPRNIVKVNDYDRTSFKWMLPKSNLAEELEQESRIVLLGEAGMGKSIELAQLAYQLEKKGKYVPILWSFEKRGQLPSTRLEDESQLDRTIFLLDSLEAGNLTSIKTTNQ